MSNRQLLWLALVAAAVLTVASSFFTVDQSSRVALFRMGQIREADYAPGLHFKLPFVDRVERYDGRLLNLDGQSENFLTQEQKTVRADYYARWRIADTLTYYRATRGDDVVAGDRLSAIVNRGLREQFALRSIQQLVADGGDGIAAALSKSSAGAAAELGVELVDVRLKRLELPEDVRDAYFDRMRAERARVASERRARGEEQAEKIRAEADRQAQAAVVDAHRDAEKLRGEGDAKAAEIYAKAYGQDPEFYSFYRSLQVYREAFRGGRDVLVLEPKGELFRYFRQPGPGSR